jgi:hypothetical protein
LFRYGEQGRRRVRELVAKIVVGGRAGRPAQQDSGEAAGDQVRVDGVGSAERARLGRLGQVQRAQDQIVGTAVERPVVGGEALHHVQVT